MDADLIKDLENKTGYSLYIDNGGNIKYKTGKDGNPLVAIDGNGNLLGSDKARNVLKGLIDDKNTLEVDINDKETTQAHENGFRMYFNPNEMQSYISGTRGVNATTMGWAMTFFHESAHTAMGGNLRDIPKSLKAPGAVEDQVVNVIRAELNAQGGNYGQRRSYEAFNINGRAYLPFTAGAHSQLNQGKAPTSGYVQIK